MNQITLIGSNLLVSLMFVLAEAQGDREKDHKFSGTFFKSREHHILISRR